MTWDSWQQPCAVDGCAEPVSIERNSRTESWRVEHRPGSEAVRTFTHSELFITSGYRPFVREIHALEAAS